MVFHEILNLKARRRELRLLPHGVSLGSWQGVGGGGVVWWILPGLLSCPASQAGYSCVGSEGLFGLDS